jgi:methionine biosynthesis protein MetW
MKLLKMFYKGSVNESERSIYKLLEKNPKAKVLDLGCWDGDLSLKVAKIIGTKKVYGIEIDPNKVKEAKLKGVIAYEEDLNKKISFKNNFFDVVIASQVIEHLYDTDNFVEEIYRVLKPNGYVIISTNNLASWHNLFALVLGYQPFPSDISKYTNIGKLIGLFKGDGKSWSHLRIFTTSSLIDLLKFYKFNINKVVGVGFYPFPQSLANIISKIDKIHCVYVIVKATKPRK